MPCGSASTSCTASGSSIPELDCQACGACCYGPEEYVSLSGPDLLRLSPQNRQRLVEKRGDRMFLRMLHRHCIALHARQGHYSCRIYRERPTPCRVVTAGDRECLAARRKRGLDIE